MPNNSSTDTLIDFIKIANQTINEKIFIDYLHLYYKCDKIISKIKERKEKPNIEGNDDAIK
jgi:hypothetical protein